MAKTTQFEKMDMLLDQHKGVLKTSDIVAEGISKPYFYEYVKKRELIKASHGIYLSPDAWADPMYLMQLRSKQVVFSHETALFLHDMTDREPVNYSVTVKSGYNPSRLTADGIKVYSIKGDLYEMGIKQMATHFGHVVMAYDLERTICDIVRSRSTIEIQTFQDALKQYPKRKDKNLRQLMKYAKAFGIEKILNQYLEVLL